MHLATCHRTNNGFALCIYFPFTLAVIDLFGKRTRIYFARDFDMPWPHGAPDV